MNASDIELEILDRIEPTESPVEDGKDPLKEFLKSTDREYPMFFEGRRGERAAIIERSNDALKQFNKGEFQRTIQGGVIVVQGPPGAGKTSIMTAVSEMRWKDSKMPVVASARINAEDLCNEEEVVRKILRQVAGVEELKDEEGNIVAWKAAKVAWAGTKVFFSAMEALSIAPGASALMENIDEAAKIAGAPSKGSQRIKTLEDLAGHMLDKEWDIPIVLLIDEFQDIRENVRRKPLARSFSETPEGEAPWNEEKREAARSVMRRIHRGELKIPVIAVCAGLSDTWETLKDMGLTRTSLSLEFNIDCLATDEAKKVALRMLERCNLDGIRKDRKKRHDFAELVTEQTNGYPQHLHNGLVELGRIAEREGGRLTQGVRDEWEDREPAIREKIYIKRVSDEMQEAGPIVASTMNEIGRKGLSDRELNSKLRREIQAFDPEGDENRFWIKRMNIKWMKEHLLHQGALQRTDQGIWRCGIESFRSWLAMSEHPLHQAALMKNEREIERLLERGWDPRVRCLDGRTATEIAELKEPGNATSKGQVSPRTARRGVSCSPAILQMLRETEVRISALETGKTKGTDDEQGKFPQISASPEPEGTGIQ